MNKILVPKVTFREIIVDEKRIEMIYSRIFDMARKNIIVKRGLTSGLSLNYTKVHNGKAVFNDPRSSQADES